MAWTLLQSFSYDHEAHLAHHRLVAAGIQARVSTLRSGLGGVVPMADALSELWVQESDASDARRVLSLTVIDGGRGLETPATCPHCGVDWEPGFEVCWSCSLKP
jgi:hypothetical protein